MENMELHRGMIDEYYSNGFVAYKAVRAFNPGITPSAGSAYYNTISRIPENRKYINDKLNVLRAETQINAVQVLRELIQFGYSDITDYIGLTTDELKALPPDLRRCISHFKRKTTKYVPRGKKKSEEVTEETVEIKLIDKLKALEMINKHIGFYSEDNKQKNVKIDLSKASNVQLNMLLNLTEDI